MPEEVSPQRLREIIELWFKRRVVQAEFNKSTFPTIREKSGWSIADWARLCGTSEQTITNWLKGSVPSAENVFLIERIAEAFGIESPPFFTLNFPSEMQGDAAGDQKPQ